MPSLSNPTQPFPGSENQSLNKLYLGIDTGGTFTDGVLLDAQRHVIVKTAKVLTTHADLKLCIRAVLERLVSDPQQGPVDPDQISMVSLSTTLATNAIVEGKSRPVGLFLLGYDSQLIYQYDFHKQFGASSFYFIPGGMDQQGNELAPLDEEQLAGRVREACAHVEAFAVSSYNGTINASHEERAGKIIADLSRLPVVQGHHLTSRYNSIRRATTASLNASLLSTAYDFLNTVQAMLAEKCIHCPLVVVRGDGSLVSADFAARRPVEIIHSGPATSAIGGLYLSAQEASDGTALVIDVGGTTTDLSVIHHGRVTMDDGSARVGPYATSVRTIRASSFGLGGDSRIRFTSHGLDSALTIGPERVVPLAYFAWEEPEVKQDLLSWLAHAPEAFYSERIEYWKLRREPRQPFRDPRTNQVIELLRGGPRRVSWLLKQVGAVSAPQVDAERLIREDIITRSGLTPTDLMHVTGEYAPWDREAPASVLAALARMSHCSLEALLEGLRNRITRCIAAEVIGFLSGKPVPVEEDSIHANGLDRWLFDQALTPDHPLLGCRIALKMPIIGIGAPARAFLPAVAEVLGTQIIFPEHYEVANAVGTVVGNVMVQADAEVTPLIAGPIVLGYMARMDGQHHQFEDAESARAFARQAACDQARSEALAAGAVDPNVEVEEQEQLGGMVAITARAIGKPGGGVRGEPL